jgi:predicted TIM-barrel fold metal-dependent hydrolase
LDSEDLLLFATDYPHWRFDRLPEAFPLETPSQISSRLAQKIRHENARAWYRL